MNWIQGSCVTDKIRLLERVGYGIVMLVKIYCRYLMQLDQGGQVRGVCVAYDGTCKTNDDKEA